MKPVLLTGLSLLGGGLAYFTQVSVGGSYVVDLLPGFLLTGVGMGFSFVPISIAPLGGIMQSEAGLASVSRSAARSGSRSSSPSRPTAPRASPPAARRSRRR